MDEAIPQSNTECVCNAVRRAARSLTNAYDRALAPTGLRITQLAALATLNKRGTASVTELAETLALDQTTATRNLLALEHSGYVERAAHHDPRVKLLRLTTKGKQKLKAAGARWAEMQKHIKATVTAAELDQLQSVLQKIDNAARRFEG